MLTIFLGSDHKAKLCISMELQDSSPPPPFDIHSFGCRLCLTYFGGLLFPIDFQKPGGIIALLDEAW